MARGQAFETMMLVISVIVALAILAVLMNILNIGNLFTQATSDPAGVMNKGLQDVVSRGYFVSQPQKVIFKPQTILRGTVKGEIPAIKTDEINFACEGDECGSGDSAAIDDNGGVKLVINKDITMNVVICGDSNEHKYCIGVARDSAEASTACIDKCGLE